MAQDVFWIKGSVETKEHEALLGALIWARSLPDSQTLAQTISDYDGSFKLEAVQGGKILLEISYLGMETRQKILELKDNLDLGRLILSQDAELLEVVEVEGKIPPLIVRGDTTEYNADAFKTNPDANIEDLVRKMPGIMVDAQGKVQAQGEDVQRVTLDGKEFFGDDARAVLKNLPAEMVDKIQIFDQLSEESQATGFDDGQTLKALNIVTKPQFRNGDFGRLQAGLGTDQRWKGSGVWNHFRENRRLSLLWNVNNINEQNFSSEDLLGVMSGGPTGGGRRGGGGGRGGRGGRGAGADDAGVDNFLVPPGDGISQTLALGLNYSENWGKKLKLSASYFLNQRDNEAQGDLFRSYYGLDNLIYAENTQAQTQNLNHRFQARLDWNLDSSNMIQFQPRLSFQQNGMDIQALSQTFRGGGLERLSDMLENSQANAWNLNGRLLYRHKFKKQGRSLTSQVQTSYQAQNQERWLQALTLGGFDPDALDSLYQEAQSLRQGQHYQASFTLTEALNRNWQTALAYRFHRNLQNSDQETKVEGLIDENLSNTFKNTYQTQAIEASLRGKIGEKLNLNFALSGQMADLQSLRFFPLEASFEQRFYNLLPSARLQYKISKKDQIRVFYRTANQAPNLDQLQDVLIQNSPLSLRLGNPDLKQDFQHNLVARYQWNDTERNRSYFAMLSGRYVQNQIAQASYILNQDSLFQGTVFLAAGGQYTRPINLDGFWQLRHFSAYSLYLKTLRSNLSFNTQALFQRSPSLVNELKNQAQQVQAGLGLSLSSNISEDVDFMFLGNSSYQYLTNTADLSNKGLGIWQHRLLFRTQARLYKGLIVHTEADFNYYAGLAQDLSPYFLRWNAALGYKFLKDRRAEFRLLAFDLLNSNTSLARQFADTYFEDREQMVLTRYLMLSFTYNFRYYTISKTARD